MNSFKLLWKEFWRDESGLVLSAEAVTVGTVGVLTAVVGMNAVGSALDSELKESALAIRSLDQSYMYSGHRGCGAWTAGSYYIQPNVQESANELYPDSEPELKAIQKRIDDERKAFAKPPGQIRVPTPTPIQPVAPQAPAAEPNQIPVRDNSKLPEPTADSPKPE